MDNLAAQGKLDPDKVQIEGILLDVIKTNVMPNFAKNIRPRPRSNSGEYLYCIARKKAPRVAGQFVKGFKLNLLSV